MKWIVSVITIGMLFTGCFRTVPVNSVNVEPPAKKIERKKTCTWDSLRKRHRCRSARKGRI
jgi:PBP1b-binding outer membrane lipoprotein LpoB